MLDEGNKGFGLFITDRGKGPGRITLPYWLTALLPSLLRGQNKEPTPVPDQNSPVISRYSQEQARVEAQKKADNFGFANRF